MADKLIKLTSGEKYSVKWLKNEMFSVMFRQCGTQTSELA